MLSSAWLGQDIDRAHPLLQDHIKTPYSRYTLSFSLKTDENHIHSRKRETTYIKVQITGYSVSDL